MLQKTVCDEGIVILTMGDKECKCCKKSQQGQKMKGPSPRCTEGYAFQSDVSLDDSKWQKLDEYFSYGCLHAGFLKQHKEIYLLSLMKGDVFVH